MKERHAPAADVRRRCLATWPQSTARNSANQEPRATATPSTRQRNIYTRAGVAAAAATGSWADSATCASSFSTASPIGRGHPMPQ